MSNNKLILLDFPSGYNFGIDLRQWTVGNNFKGIKNIPDGCHFVYYGPKEDSHNIGFWLYSSSGNLSVKKWSKTKEDFEDINLTNEGMCRYHDNIAEIDQYLGSYFMENHRDWWSISNFITPHVMNHLMPQCGRIYSVDQFLSKPSSVEDRKNFPPKYDKDGLIELECNPIAKINFSTIPRLIFPGGSSDLTKHMMDKTFTLDGLIQSKEFYKQNPKSLLGELQFAFVTYNLVFVLAAFEQWLAILDLLSNCVEAVTKYQDLYVSFIAVLHYQLKLTNEDFADITTNKNKFYIAMKRLFEVILEETNVTDELKIKTNGLKEMMMEKYEWNFDVEMDDELPVIVDYINE